MEEMPDLRPGEVISDELQGSIGLQQGKHSWKQAQYITVERIPLSKKIVKVLVTLVLWVGTNDESFMISRPKRFLQYLACVTCLENVWHKFVFEVRKRAEIPGEGICI